MVQFSLAGSTQMLWPTSHFWNKSKIANDLGEEIFLKMAVNNSS
jgi:hypothetical protein